MAGIPCEVVRVRIAGCVDVPHRIPWFLGAPPGEGAHSGDRKTLIKHYTDEDRDKIQDSIQKPIFLEDLLDAMMDLQTTCSLAMSVYNLMTKDSRFIGDYNCTGYATVPIVSEAFKHMEKIKRILMQTKRDSRGYNAHTFMQEHPELNLLPDDLFQLLMDRDAPVPALVWTGSDIKYFDFRLHNKTLNRGKTYMYKFPGIDKYVFPVLHHGYRKNCIHVFSADDLPGLVLEQGDALFISYDNE